MIPTERLLLLADRLEEDATNPSGMKFDLQEWFGEETNAHNRPALDCNTTGCAIGLAMLTPEFNAEGFKADADFDPIFVNADIPAGWDAVQAYFGLTFSEAANLFSHASYLKGKGATAELAVAKRIRRFVTAQ